jgi:hypothetical protein
MIVMCITPSGRSPPPFGVNPGVGLYERNEKLSSEFVDGVGIEVIVMSWPRKKKG